MAISAFFWVIQQEKNVATADDDGFFVEALNQAYFCAGSTHPNPNVGAVIVKEGKIIAKGFTRPAGGPHAEVQAIKNAHGDVRGCSMYVTLEPCSHFGRTPPCVDAIIKAGIKEVIFGAYDPNPQVHGCGILALKNAGVVVKRVENPHLHEKAEALIAPFRKSILTKMPYVVLKVATSSDGRLSSKIGHQTKITGPQADEIVHELRRAIDCVAVGANTVRIDNPLLTARLGQVRHGHQPHRLVISSSLNLDANARIFDQTVAKTYVSTSLATREDKLALFRAKEVEIIPCETQENLILLKPMLRELAARGITSLLVEAGGHLCKSFMASQVVDELWWFTSKQNFGPGTLGVDFLPQQMDEQGFVCAHDEAVGVDQLNIYKSASKKSNF